LNNTRVLISVLLTGLLGLALPAADSGAARYYCPTSGGIFRTSRECSVESSTITVAITGDVIPHIALLRCAGEHSEGEKNNHGFDYLFERVAPWIETADIACFNAEFPAADRMRQSRGPYLFNAPRALVDALAAAGFDVANLANNHSYDQGTYALPETRDAFIEAGIVPVGIGRNAGEAGAAGFVEKSGFRVAFLGASRLLPEAALDDPPGRPHANYFRLEEMLESIRNAAREADIVVVNVHWGGEYARSPRKEELALARRMMDAGADVIAGHHPHVLQPVMDYVTEDGRRAVAAMSLGNFISNQAPYYDYGKSRLSYGDTRGGALVRVAFKREGLKVSMAGWDAVPLWTWSDGMEKRACRGCPYNMQVWAIPEAVDRLERMLASEGISESRRKHLVRMREDLRRRESRIMESLGAYRVGVEVPGRSGVEQGVTGRSFP